MSQFYADIQGSKGMATRQGSKKSGISGHIRGWHIGARVELYYDKETGKDVCFVYKTGGSSGHFSQELIAKFTS